MRFPTREVVERISGAFPAGTLVELVKMDDAQAPPTGTLGEVIAVDDIGSLIVKWKNGSTLNVIYGEDTVRKVKKEDRHEKK